MKKLLMDKKKKKTFQARFFFLSHEINPYLYIIIIEGVKILKNLLIMTLQQNSSKTK